MKNTSSHSHKKYNWGLSPIVLFVLFCYSADKGTAEPEVWFNVYFCPSYPFKQPSVVCPPYAKIHLIIGGAGLILAETQCHTRINTSGT